MISLNDLTSALLPNSTWHAQYCLPLSVGYLWRGYFERQSLSIVPKMPIHHAKKLSFVNNIRKERLVKPF